MTYEDVISLGWQDRWPSKKEKKGMKSFVFPSPGYDYHIMSICFDMDEDDGVYDQVMIKCTPEGTKKNEWENSECNFYGYVKTKEELSLVMQFVGVIKYEGIIK